MNTLQDFIDDVDLVVRTTDDQYEITKRVAQRLSALLAGDYQLPPQFTRASEEHHVNYPLYIHRHHRATDVRPGDRSGPAVRLRLERSRRLTIGHPGNTSWSRLARICPKR